MQRCLNPAPGVTAFKDRKGVQMLQFDVPSPITVEELLTPVSQELPHVASVTWCRIGLPSARHDRFTIRTAHAVRELPWDPHVGREFALTPVSNAHRRVGDGESVILPPEDVRRVATLAPSYPLLDQGLQSLAFVPLRRRQRTLGLITLGEMRSWTRSPITEEKVRLCRVIASQATIALETVLRFQTVHDQLRHLEQLFEQRVADLVLVIDRQGNIRWVNRAVEELTGHSREAMRGTPYTEIFAVAGEEGCPLTLAMEQRAATFSRAFEVCITSAPQRVLRLTGVAVPLVGEAGEVEGAIGLFWRLATDKPPLPSEDTLLFAVLHELRTSLANIQLAADIALRYSQDDKESTEGLFQSIARQVERLRLFSDALLESRREGPFASSRLRPLNLAPVVAKAVSLYEGFAASHPISVRIDAGATWVLADENYLLTILCNLLDNAIKYSPDGGAIHIEARTRNEGEVLITVTDEGLGIPAEQQERIFEKFYRLRSDQAHPARGAGLGLYLVKQLLEAQSGRIWVESERGAGASFSFTLLKPALGPD